MGGELWHDNGGRDAVPLSPDHPGDVADQVLQRLFNGSLALCRALRSPESKDDLIRATIVTLDESIRLLRATLPGIDEDTAR